MLHGNGKRARHHAGKRPLTREKSFWRPQHWSEVASGLRALPAFPYSRVFNTEVRMGVTAYAGSVTFVSAGRSIDAHNCSGCQGRMLHNRMNGYLHSSQMDLAPAGSVVPGQAVRQHVRDTCADSTGLVRLYGKLCLDI